VFSGRSATAEKEPLERAGFIHASWKIPEFHRMRIPTYDVPFKSENGPHQRTVRTGRLTRTNPAPGRISARFPALGSPRRELHLSSFAGRKTVRIWPRLHRALHFPNAARGLPLLLNPAHRELTSGSRDISRAWLRILLPGHRDAAGARFSLCGPTESGKPILRKTKGGP